MPIHKVAGGYKWGNHGHVYPSRAGAARQAAAAYAHGYTGDMDRRRMDLLRGLMSEFFTEEANEPEHAGDAEAKVDAAGVAFVTPDGEILFLKRGDGSDHAGEWCLPGGGADDGDDDPEDTARREAEEETGFKAGRLYPGDDRTGDDGVRFVTFLHPVTEQFEPRPDDEHVGFKWAKPGEAPQPLHPGVKATLAGDASQAAISARIKREVDRGHPQKQAAAIAYKELGEAKDENGKEAYELREMELENSLKRQQAHDEAFAFDRASVRTKSVDGHLHVERTHISKAAVNGYLGREIPDYDKLGLDPDRMYQLLRDPEELRRAAPTFNNKPLLSKHVAVTADEFPEELVVGTTGSDAEFNDPYLDNSLALWKGEDIEDVENDKKKELSSAYRYRADMTPGRYQGVPYDGVMRDIIGNHVALVKEGRAGADVVVGDSALPSNPGEIEMVDKVLSRKAILVHGMLASYLLPKLAKDAKIDLAPALDGVSAKNFKDKQSGIIEAVKGIVKDKLAKDASIEDLPSVVERAEHVHVPEGSDVDPNSGLPMSEEDMRRRTMDEEPDDADKFLKSKLSAEDWAAYDQLRHRAHDAEPEEEEERREQAQDETVTKTAMDQALKSTRQQIVAEQKAIRDAERHVRPWVGELALAFDSAVDVYHAALKTLGVKDADQIKELPALKAVLEVQQKPGDKKNPAFDAAIVANDASVVSDYNKMFPNAARISA